MGAASLSTIPNRVANMAIVRTMAREAYPRTVEEMHQWAAEMWDHSGIYSQAIKAAVRYFMTEVEVLGDDIGVEEKQTYAQVVNANFDVLGELSQIGDDYMGWGTSITTHHYPFIRNLQCPKEDCGMQRSISSMREIGAFSWTAGGFSGECPGCRRKVEYLVKDLVRTDDDARCFVTRWPQQVCEMAYNLVTGSRDVTIDVVKYSELRDPILRGDPIYLDETPWEIVQAAVKGEKIKLHRDRVFVLATEVPAFSHPSMMGWGKAPFMNAFDDVFMVRMLDRFNEAIVSERIMPFNILSPPPMQQNPAMESSANPLMSHSDMNYAAELQRLIARHRKNPTGYKLFPFPIANTMIGGDAKGLITPELEQYYEGRILRVVGIPQEFANPSADTMPIIAFQLFEKRWQHYANRLNAWIKWLFAQQAKYRKWKDVEARLVPVAMKSDPQVLDITMNQIAAGAWPAGMLDRMMGHDPVRLFKQKLEEEAWKNDLLASHQKRMQEKADNAMYATIMTGAQVGMQAEMAAQQGGAPVGPGGMPAGPMPAGMPAGPGGATAAPGGATIEGLMDQASQKAQELYVLDPLTKRRELQRIKATDQTMYNQIKGIMAQMETDAEAQGRIMSRQPQQGAM